MSGQEKFSFKVTQASLNQTSMDFPRNTANIYAAIRKAVDDKADFLALEELTLTGYEANDDFQKSDNETTRELLEDIAAYAAALDPNLIISVGHTWRLHDRNIKAQPGLESELADNPLFNRLDLPFNVQSIIANGQVKAMTAKMHLFTDERGYEGRYFQKWKMQAANEAGGNFGTIMVPFGDRMIPFGRPIGHIAERPQRNVYDDLYDFVENLVKTGVRQRSLAGIFKTAAGFVRPLTKEIALGFRDRLLSNSGLFLHKVRQDLSKRLNLSQLICEERWVGTKFGGAPYTDEHYDRLGVAPAILRRVGSREGLFLNIPNASPPSSLKIDKHKHLVALASRYADVVVDTDGLGSSGSTFAQFGHQLVAQDGKIISSGARAQFDRMVSTTSTVAVNSAPASTRGRAHYTISHEFRNSAKKPTVALAHEKQALQAWDDPANPNRHAEEVLRMTALWLFDYMRKSKVQGIAEALSGGADSAFNSTMVRAMVDLAVSELGVEGFLKEMSHLSYADKIREAAATGGKEAAVKVCMQNMLTAVYMGTKNSSFDTYEAARTLIEGRTEKDWLVLHTLTVAVKNVEALELGRRLELQEAVWKYFDQNPENVSVEELDRQAADLRSQFPEIKGDLVSAADPRQKAACAALRQEALKGETYEGIGGTFRSRSVQDLLDFYALNEAVEDTTKLSDGRKAELQRAVAGYLNQRTGSVTTAELDVQMAALRAKYPELKNNLISAADPRQVIAYENIQARARQVLIMLIANKEGKMAIANPNLDEARNAYATFGGDLHSGTVNLNVHLNKAYQLQLMHYLKGHGLDGAMAPVKGLTLTLKNKPSAELQPRGINGELLQTDETALQRTFVQMDRISRLMLNERATTKEGGLRRLNASEIYAACKKEEPFANVSENGLYNMIKMSYKTWATAQHKIHAGPLGPTFGLNVDHQTSLRTPNLSGWSKDELAILGIELMQSWAQEEKSSLGFDAGLALKRARQDEGFIDAYEKSVRNQKNSGDKMDFDLKGLYDRIKLKGWDSVFAPLSFDHPLMVVRQYKTLALS